MGPDEEMGCDGPGRQEPTWESRGGGAGITLGMGIVAVYIAVFEVLDIVPREAVMNGGRSRAR